MRTTLKLLFLATLSTGLLSCTIVGDTIKPSKKYITRDYKVSGFDQIDASTVGDITYTQSTDSSSTLQISGPENFIELVKIVINQEGTMVLGMNKKVNMKSSKLKIKVSTPHLKSIRFKGVGDVFITKGFTAEEFQINSKGVGNIEADSLVCGKLTVESSGVGNVELRGTVEKAFLSSKGVGDIDAAGLKATHVEASSKGVGNITCYAAESIDASVKGVGSITYKGKPTNKSFSKKGVGSIKEY